MASKKKVVTDTEEVKEPKRRRLARTDVEEENEMVSLATELARKQLRAGTASSQVITHYLRLGTTREKLEKDKLAKENELLAAKTEEIKSRERSEERYKEAFDAMREYSGAGKKEDDSFEIFDD